MSVSYHKWSRLLLVGFAAILLVTTGCRRKAQVTANRATITTTTEQTSTFDTAIDFLNSLDRFRPETAQQQILTNLGDWSRQETTSIDWIADPMINDLPEELKPSVKSLEVTAYGRADVLDLQEAVWLRDISRAVSQQPLADAQLEKWLDQAIQDTKLTGDQAADLSLVYRLFDWTVRNMQLDAADDPDDVLPASMAGGEPLRHRYAPWQCLLYGHADWIERSRIHILLCRQVGIDCVMLVAGRGAAESEQPWCVAAKIGDQLYLFDALLGLPLPGQGGAPFSTLTDYVENPALLDELIVGSESYRIATSDLTDLYAHIDASPSALSQRMKQIESRLNGIYKMSLTSTPTTLARMLRSSSPHLKGSQIWLEPYRTIQFLQAFLRDASGSPKLLERLQLEQQPFQTRSSLLRGRLMHLRGNYRGEPNNPDEPGANKLYMDSRPPQRELERFSTPLETMREVAKKLPSLNHFIAGLPENPAEAQAEYQRRLASALAAAIWSKDNASIWLAMIAFEKQEFEVAKNHLLRLLENPDSKWLQTARYNLGRSYEALGKKHDDATLIAEAIEIYESDEPTPQKAGNRLRAKLLRASQ